MGETLVDQPLAPQKFVGDIFHVAMLPVKRVIQLPHLLVGNLAAQLRDSLRDFWMLPERLLANHWHRLIGRKIVAVVVEDEQVEGRNQTIRRITGGDIDLMIFQRRGEQS